MFITNTLCYNTSMANILLRGKRAGMTIIDDEDYNRLVGYGWIHGALGYAIYAIGGRKNRRMLYLHREVMQAKGGQEIDHVNGDKLDNRKINLRFVNSSQNKMNRKLQSNNISGFRGVYWHAKAGKWAIEIQHNKKKHYLGLHDTKDQAIEIAKDFYQKNNPEYRGWL